ncbi:MAG: hypothetical protein LBS36_04260 [Oscillospiraceae bacterium]|nr:hypothetical protein [Oscillospiraceae bacterium]
MSVKAKKIFKEFLSKNEGAYPSINSKFIEKLQASMIETIENDETHKSLNDIYDELSSLLVTTFTPAQRDLFYEIEEVISDQLYISSHLAYENGLLEGIVIHSHYISLNMAVKI